jgi:hypothetical protein
MGKDVVAERDQKPVPVIPMPYGTPYDYKTRKVTYFFKPIQK